MTTNSFMRKSRTSRNCEICGRIIPAGTDCYIRDGLYPALRCLECHAKKKEEWLNKRNARNDLVEKLILEMFRPSSEIRDDFSAMFDDQRMYTLTINKLVKEKGYSIQYAEDGCFITNSPEIQSFILDLKTLQDIDIYIKYGESWIIYCYGIYLKAGFELDHIQSAYRNHHLDFEHFSEIYRVLVAMNEKLTDIYFSETCNLNRISDDDVVYNTVCDDVRHLVFNSLIRELLKSSEKAEYVDDGIICINDNMKNYIVLLDDGIQENNPFCDLEIIVSEFGISCIDYSEEYGGIPTDISEYLLLNISLCNVVEYICKLKGSGF